MLPIFGATTATIADCVSYETCCSSTMRTERAHIYGDWRFDVLLFFHSAHPKSACWASANPEWFKLPSFAVQSDCKRASADGRDLHRSIWYSVTPYGIPVALDGRYRKCLKDNRSFCSDFAAGFSCTPPKHQAGTTRHSGNRFGGIAGVMQR
jgi:hypothetical protein